MEKVKKQHNHLCQCEIDWINNNIHRYDSYGHAQAVIGNIKKAYFMRETERLIKKYDNTRTTGDMFNLFNHFGLIGL